MRARFGLSLNDQCLSTLKPCETRVVWCACGCVVCRVVSCDVKAFRNAGTCIARAFGLLVDGARVVVSTETFLTVAYSAVVCSERRRRASLTTTTKADRHPMHISWFRTQPDSFEQRIQGQIVPCSRDVPTRARKRASPSRHRHRGFQSDFSLFIAQCRVEEGLVYGRGSIDIW